MRGNEILSRLLLVGAVALVCVAAAPAAEAADTNFCRDYAAAAIRQAELGYSIPRCRPGMGGPRWATDFRVHYDWCLGASYEAAGVERDIRRRHIDACR